MTSLAILLCNTAVFSQVGINTDNPKSTLDTYAKNYLKDGTVERLKAKALTKL